MQNLIPEFGIRSAVALALAALAVVAALLAVGSPASAQSSDDGEEIWSSTMTVGSFIISKGYTSEGVGIGSLSDDSFILGRHTFEVSLIYDRIISSQLYVGFGNRQANDGEVRAMTLHIGGRRSASRMPPMRMIPPMATRTSGFSFRRSGGRTTTRLT